MDTKKLRVAVLGATGSIGRQTLEVIREHSDQMRAVAISLNENITELKKICDEFKPGYVGLRNEKLCADAKGFVGDAEFVCGEGCNEAIAQLPEVDIVVMAITGMQAIFPLLSAIKKGKPVALANKECIVCGGEWMQRKCLEYGATIYPVDSEQSAIFQCLQGLASKKEVEKLILTASGGPFLKVSYEEMAMATPGQALKHPTWTMGKKISIDSATMINKGLEVIEACYLFNMPYQQVKVLIHPQSIVHSMVETRDGAVMAQLGCSDMRLPIQYALTYPNRIALSTERLNLAKLGALTFFEPDLERFEGLGFAYEAMKLGGTAPAIYNAANEAAVDAYLKEQIGFLDIARIVGDALSALPSHQPILLEDILDDDRKAREYVCQRIS